MVSEGEGRIDLVLVRMCVMYVVSLSELPAVVLIVLGA